MEKRKPKIIAVDDDVNILELLELNLQVRDFDVVTISDSRKAMDVIDTEMPDLVILDIMMPHIDGWEICKMIRDSEHLADVKILMLTAKGAGRDKMIGKEILKADEYVTKPFNLNDLLSVVRRLIDEGRVTH